MIRIFTIIIVSLFVANCTSVPTPQKGQSLESYMASVPFSGAVLVAKGDKVLLKRGYGFANIEQNIRNTADTVFRTGSVGKQLTAMAIMQLHEQGQLNINDSVTKYFPDQPQWSKIKVVDLLRHSAGLYDYTDQWDAIKARHNSPQDLINIFKDKPLNFEPGTKVSYSSSGYILAGVIIEQVSDLTFEGFVEQEIFENLGMKNSEYSKPLEEGSNYAVGYKQGKPDDFVDISTAYAAGGFVSTIEDLYLWDRSFYERPLVGKESMEAIFPSDRAALGAGFGTGRHKVVMGLGWGVYETAYGPEYFHQGNLDGFSAGISRYPEQKAFIVVLSNEKNYDVYGPKNNLAKLVLGD